MQNLSYLASVFRMTFNQGVGGSIPPCLRREKRLKLSSFKSLSLFVIFAFCPEFDENSKKCICHFHIKVSFSYHDKIRSLEPYPLYLVSALSPQ